jgi:uncharacterized membrane protein YedE/YeeE
MALRIAAVGLGLCTGFVFGWSGMTDPATFHRMLALESPTIYLLMASTVAVAFVGARLLRGRPALLTGETIGWRGTGPARGHVVGSVLFGIGWGISDACPGPVAAQLGSGRVLAFAVATGVVAGVAVQPQLAAALQRATRRGASITPIVEADVL